MTPWGWPCSLLPRIKYLQMFQRENFGTEYLSSLFRDYLLLGILVSRISWLFWVGVVWYQTTVEFLCSCHDLSSPDMLHIFHLGVTLHYLLRISLCLAFVLDPFFPESHAFLLFCFSSLIWESTLYNSSWESGLWNSILYIICAYNII